MIKFTAGLVERWDLCMSWRKITIIFSFGNFL